MSEPEVMLWSRLRRGGDTRPRFRRQHPFGSIVLDFYCPAARLCVEVDGSTHWDEAKRAKDAARDRWLEGQGVVVKRVPAGAIFRDLDAVAHAVILQAEALIGARAPAWPLAPLFVEERLGWRGLPGRPPDAATPGGLSVEGPLPPEPVGLRWSWAAADIP